MRTSKKIVTYFIQAFATGLALTTSFLVEDIEWAGIHNGILNRIYTMLEQLRAGYSDCVMESSVLICAVFLFYYLLWIEKKAVSVRGSKGVSAFLALMYTGSLACYCDDSLSILWRYKVNLLRGLVVFFGMYFFFHACINLLYRLLQSRKDIVCSGKGIFQLYRKHPFVLIFVLILLAWLPHVVLRYPGVMSYDNYNQLKYFYGFSTYTTAQPIFHTWLFGVFVDVGVKLGSANAGLFAFVIMQVLIMAAILDAMLTLMKRWGVSRWLRLLTMAIICIAPYYTGYAAFPIKDYLYTACFMAMLLLIMEYIREPHVFSEGKKKILLPVCWVVSCALMILFRKNGLYLYVGCVLLLLPALMKGRKRYKEVKKYLVTAAICLLLPLALVEGTEKAITVAYDVEQDNPKEMLSIFFQQTARYVRDYGEEVTKEEEEAIAAVLDYESLAEIYMESLSDPVKTTYHADSAEELVEYFKVWFAQFLKHPICYIEATWNQNYYLFAPFTDVIIFNQDCYVGAETIWDEEYYSWLHFDVPDSLEGFNNIFVSLYTALTTMPVIGLFSNIAFYVMLMFVMLFFFIADGRAGEGKVLIPVILSFLIVILAPGILIHPRYAFPIIYGMPAVIGFYASKKKTDIRETQAEGKKNP